MTYDHSQTDLRNALFEQLMHEIDLDTVDHP